MKQPNQRGVIALITSIIVGLLLILVTLAGIAITGTELRQATDFDQSIKAYYAAESGLEDAVAYINDQVTDNGLTNIESAGCDAFDLDGNGTGNNDSNLSGDNQRTVSYTCQNVTVSQNAIAAKLATEDTVQIDLSGGIGSSDILKIEWNLVGSDDPQNWIANNLPLLFTTGQNWIDQITRGRLPAVVEFTAIEYPRNSTFNSSDIKTVTHVLKPSLNGTNGPQSLAIGTVPNGPVSVVCQTPTPLNDGQYSCSMQFTGFDAASKNYVIRLLPPLPNQA